MGFQQKEIDALEKQLYRYLKTQNKNKKSLIAMRAGVNEKYRSLCLPR
ncbi:hypothetical protein KBC97_03160 [Candidatus Gracilibacteria bacterium]|nr:hypothetical protein [Candidatus Gracilibacteria bacterium]